MIVYRHNDPEFPFLRSTPASGGRWYVEDVPVQYFADSPITAWAEHLRHEEIREAEDVLEVRQSLWSVQLPDAIVNDLVEPELDEATMTGGPETYADCSREALRLYGEGARGLIAPSAATLPGLAGGQCVVDDELVPGPEIDGRTVVLFGEPQAIAEHCGDGESVWAWRLVLGGWPAPGVLAAVRHFGI